MMEKVFKYLRFSIAISLLILISVRFGNDLIQQSKAILDGPLAWYIDYTFIFNKFVLALMLSMIFLFDFTISFPSWGKLLLRIVGIIAIGITLAGFFFLIRHHLYLGRGIGLLHLIELYLFQLAYLIAAIIVYQKTLKENSNA